MKVRKHMHTKKKRESASTALRHALPGGPASSSGGSEEGPSGAAPRSALCARRADAVLSAGSETPRSARCVSCRRGAASCVLQGWGASQKRSDFCNCALKVKLCD